MLEISETARLEAYIKLQLKQAKSCVDCNGTPKFIISNYPGNSSKVVRLVCNKCGSSTPVHNVLIHKLHEAYYAIYTLFQRWNEQNSVEEIKQPINLDIHLL